MQITDALGRFLLQLEADGRSQHTVRQYGRHVRQLAIWAARVGHSAEIEEVTPEDLARFLVADEARLTPEGSEKRPGSVNALRGSIKGFFGFLHRAGLMHQDPSRLLKRAICGPPPPRGLTPAEETRLREALAAGTGPEAERDRMLIELMLATGIRLSSALAATVQDVDLDEGTLVLRQVKRARVQRVILGAQVRSRLTAYLEGRGSGPLFASKSGRPITSRHAQRRFRKLRETAGITSEVSPHSLRHCFGQRLYEKTADLLLVKEALGHASISSTLVYTKTGEGRLRAVLGG